MTESRPDPYVGRTIGGYRVEEVVGRGGMGTVYRATQLSLGRPVALKVLPGEFDGDAQFLERFHREADILSKLSHPNVVTVFDRGEVDGRPWLAMEYVEGTNLRDLVREGPLAPGEALRIVSSVLSALEHAHAAGIVHRDIKPENVLLARGGIVKVADFGLSVLLGPEERTRLTRTHLVLGTYEYMAPEQREKAREADARADLYATGVVLYEMLTGELPIGRFAMPSRRRPDECDARIDRLIERSLEKDPDERYQRASEMAEAVSGILDHPEAFERVAPDARAAPPVGAARPAAPSLPPRYRPARFEHHLDNLATIDHVLGTVCYVLGFALLFSMFRNVLVGMPFWVFFVLGWYLRKTAAEMRKFRASARTGQAVIAILAAPTGVLLPFTIYSFWTLYSHRGRTWYEARGRGLDSHEAARYTWRLLEEPWPPRASEPARPAPPAHPARPPSPSRIPVQSMVTSSVEPEPGARVEPRLSGFIKAGLALFAVVLALTVVAGTAGVGVGWMLVAPLFGLTLLLLLIGFFHALVSPRAKGAAAAFLLLVLFGLLSTALLWSDAGTSEDWRSDPAVPAQAVESFGGYSETPLAEWAIVPSSAFDAELSETFFDADLIDWLDETVGIDRRRADGMRLVSQGDRIRLRLPHGIASGARHQQELCYAVLEALKRRFPRRVEVVASYPVAPEVARRIAETPLPEAAPNR